VEGRTATTADTGGYAGIDGLLIVVEIVAAGTGAASHASRMAAYARAGVPRYWLAEQDGTVHRHALGAEGSYEAGPGGILRLDE
jgi:hypothetical protein